MNPFLQTFSLFGGAVAAICCGMILSTLFFKVMSWLSRTTTSPESVEIQGVITNKTWCSITLNSGQKYENVRVIGMTKSQSGSSDLPLELDRMLILEDAQQQRYLIRAKNVLAVAIPAP